MVELRKRKAPTESAAPAKKAATRGKKSKPESPAPAEAEVPAEIEEAKEKAEDVTGDTKETEEEKPDTTEKKVAAKKETNGKPAASASAPVVIAKEGDTISLDTFGGEVTTHDGVKTSLKDLVEKSESGVILFTYPKANTPGCKLFPPCCFF
jgi:peroxiredoxin Q/BCP